MLAYLQAHSALFLSLASAILAFVIGIHPAWDDSPVVLFLSKVLGISLPPPPPPAPPAA